MKKSEKIILRNKISDILTQRWNDKPSSKTKATVHVGPTNSGKTFSAIQSLKSGTYLAPLRLLSWEVADKLNENGVPCSLVTGEEINEVPDARVVSSTIEMFNVHSYYDTVVVDECQMLADRQRGWAWTRAIAFAKTDNLHLIVAPHAIDLLTRLLKKLDYEYDVNEYTRLSELKIGKICDVNDPPEQTVFVSFSRKGVLTLKNFFESKGYKVSVIYGALPPDVRKRQAARFRDGETQVCVSTDAIGMGLNLPATTVCFTQMYKFDGEGERLLFPEEVLQIGGRAGRHKNTGYVTASNAADLSTLRELFRQTPRKIDRCYVAPELEDLEVIDGNLYTKLTRWEYLNAIPENLTDIFKLTDLSDQKTMASMLGRHENSLSLEEAFTLVKTPASKMTYDYWQNCVNKIANRQPLEMPINKNNKIKSGRQLERAETLIEQCEIYCWLSNRHQFREFGQGRDSVVEEKNKLSSLIDDALLRKIDTAARCAACKKKLPVSHKFNKCDKCYWSQY